jgi:flagellar motor switch protein FliG
MEEKNAEKGIYINGRQQIIDMLQFMSEPERKKLLNNISMRNTVMARELGEQSLSFSDLVNVPEDSLSKIFAGSNPAIIGLALYTCTSEMQRKVLSVIPRDTAEKAFEIMSKNLGSKKAECKRAQQKILQTVIELSRRQQIVI